MWVRDIYRTLHWGIKESIGKILRLISNASTYDEPRERVSKGEEGGTKAPATLVKLLVLYMYSFVNIGRGARVEGLIPARLEFLPSQISKMFRNMLA